MNNNTMPLSVQIDIAEVREHITLRRESLMLDGRQRRFRPAFFERYHLTSGELAEIKSSFWNQMDTDGDGLGEYYYDRHPVYGLTSWENNLLSWSNHPELHIPFEEFRNDR